MARPDLFTVVHEQFFTDTADYADIVLPATTFLEHNDIQGAYGHYYVQLSDQAIDASGRGTLQRLAFWSSSRSAWDSPRPASATRRTDLHRPGPARPEAG